MTIEAKDVLNRPSGSINTRRAALLGGIANSAELMGPGYHNTGLDFLYYQYYNNESFARAVDAMLVDLANIIPPVPFSD